MGGMRIWVAEEICEGDGGEGVVVGEGRFVKFDHCDGICFLLASVEVWFGGGLVMHLKMVMRRRDDEQKVHDAVDAARKRHADNDLESFLICSPVKVPDWV